MRVSTLVLSCSLLASFASASEYPSSRTPFNIQSLNLWRLDKKLSQTISDIYYPTDQTPFAVSSKPQKFAEQWFEQPLDHFTNDPRTFKQRYWVNDRHYREGGPVIVLDGGETSGENRIPFLDTGIVEILAKATQGVGIVLEHRYYGKSIPVSNFSTDSMRWLNNAQSAADSANFMSKVKFESIEKDLTAPNTPWIYYGGSYAGARAAHMKILYPELVYGAIASSGVTHATIENWEYMEIIRQAAEPDCSRRLESAIELIDALLAMPHARKLIKDLFGLADLEHDDDFVSLLEAPLSSWQAKNWDPEVGSTKFEEFCESLAKPVFGFSSDEILSLPGGLDVPVTVWNYAKYIKERYVSKCPEGETVEDCFGSYDDSKFQDTDISQEWRAWIFQVCTEWGYFSTAPPDPDHPRIVSRLLTLESSSRICQQAFPPGSHLVVPQLPNVTAVNVLGDFSIAADRLAIIDGEVDPWRPATPHSEYAPHRPDTIIQPFKLILNGVHHYDEFGLQDMYQEPPEILKIHLEMIDFVQEWLSTFGTTGTE